MKLVYVGSNPIGHLKVCIFAYFLCDVPLIQLAQYLSRSAENVVLLRGGGHRAFTHSSLILYYLNDGNSLPRYDGWYAA